MNGRFPTPALLVLLLVATVSTGCIYSREVQHTRRDIERANPDLYLRKRFSANVGPVTIRLARWITSAVDDEDANMAARYLRDIRRVKVGVYAVRGSVDGIDGISELRRFQRSGWDLAAHVREDGEDVWLYYRERGDRVTDMYAIVYSDDELVIARLSGRLNDLVEEAVREQSRASELGDWDFWN